MLGNLLAGRHARIRTSAPAEMLLLPSIRGQEVAQRAAVETITGARWRRGIRTMSRMIRR